MTGRVGENNGAKREKVSRFVGIYAISKSTRIRTSPRKHARVGIKKTNRMKGWFLVLAGRRELNLQLCLINQSYIILLCYFCGKLK
ncbi:hypothetical protein BCL69_11062 [Nitrosomonas communis]|uniref:Uncharacterized protein n=1 Tax=Nitrosomonas communis TaxID=44574 RepID=A0A5D3Y6S5_9PROT|nr:hypothetical protein BCL69_11062 [Nitrosomonas communis]